MKKLFIILSLITAFSWTPTYSSFSPKTIRTAWTALATVAGVITSGWVLKHHWYRAKINRMLEDKNKYISKEQDKLSSDSPEAAAWQQKHLINDQNFLLAERRNIANSFLEKNKYLSIFLGSTGAAIAGWGIKSLLTNK